MTKQRSRRQIKAAHQRLENAKKVELDELTLKQNAERLKNMVGGFASKNSDRRGKRSSLLFPSPYHRETPPIPSLTLNEPIKPSEKPRLSPEMQLREVLAQEEIKKKRSRVAVLFNKGGLQYISDEMDPKTFGRK